MAYAASPFNQRPCVQVLGNFASVKARGFPTYPYKGRSAPWVYTEQRDGGPPVSLGSPGGTSVIGACDDMEPWLAGMTARHATLWIASFFQDRLSLGKSIMLRFQTS
jgi:hypothetical protein